MVCIFLACFIMMSPIAFIISPRISIICAIIFGSIDGEPAPIGIMPRIMPPPIIIWLHISMGIIPPAAPPVFGPEVAPDGACS